MRAPVSSQVWVLRSCRLCQALPSAPPPLVGVCPVVRPLLPCPFRVRPPWARCVGVGVFSSFPFFFCVPHLVFRLGSLSFHGHFHLVFMFISSTLLQQGVCVGTTCTDVKLPFGWLMVLVCFFLILYYVCRGAISCLQLIAQRRGLHS